MLAVTLSRNSSKILALKKHIDTYTHCVILDVLKKSTGGHPIVAIFVFTLNLVMESATRKGRGLVEA